MYRCSGFMSSFVRVTSRKRCGSFATNPEFQAPLLKVHPKTGGIASREWRSHSFGPNAEFALAPKGSMMTVSASLRKRTRSLRPGTPASSPNQRRRIVGSSLAEAASNQTLKKCSVDLANKGRFSRSRGAGHKALKKFNSPRPGWGVYGG